jgi:glycosyltransferase involved in cell wall biosynthesis
MKILILPSIRLDSGTGLRLIGLADSLAELGHDVCLAGPGLQGKLKHARYVEIKKRCGIKKIIFSTFSNIRLLKKMESDVIIASKAHPVSCIPAIIAGGRAKKILDFDDLEHAYWKNPLKRAFLKTMEKILPDFFDYITTHNEDLKAYLIENVGVPERKILLLPQGIDAKMFRKEKTGLSKKLGLEKKKTVLYAAHLGPAAADLGVVFEAIKNLRDRATLLVIGDGIKLRYYKNLAREMGLDNVVFTGHVKHEAMPQYLSIADAAVNFMRSSPANRCRASIKVREYLAFGLPTVCNIVGSDLKIFEEYVYPFRENDMRSFEKALLDALEDRAQKAGKAKNYMQRWDWGTIAKAFEKQLEAIVKS